MPDALSTALAMPGLWMLVGTVFAAGLVRGFAGFGTGMVYLPVAAQVLPPIWAIVTVIVFDIFGPLVIARRALRDAHVPDLARLFGGTALGLPIGLTILFLVSEGVFQTAVSVLALTLLSCLLLGVKYRGALTPRLVYGTGGLSGMLGGSTGAPAPPIILLYLASAQPAARVRANTTLYLLGYDICLLGVFLALGRLDAVPLWIGLVLAVPNALGNFCGAALFRPGYERLYRGAAYTIIAISALSGLQIWN